MLPNSEITDQQKDEAEVEIREKQKIVDYNTNEYPVEVLVQKYREGLSEDINELYVPDYQREMIWDDVRQSKFIESILLGKGAILNQLQWRTGLIRTNLKNTLPQMQVTLNLK